MRVEIEISTDQIEEIAAKAATKALNQFSGRSGTVQPKDETEDLGGIETAVKVTGLSRQTIYRKSSEGTIPVMRKGGKLYFSRKQLVAWITSGAKKTVAELSDETDTYLSKGKGAKK